jgi:hypothetical protein
VEATRARAAAPGSDGAAASADLAGFDLDLASEPAGENATDTRFEPYREVG